MYLKTHKAPTHFQRLHAANCLFSLFQIRSDNLGDVQYSLHGKGADKSPYNVFFVEPDTGLMKITRKLDREVIPQYNVRVISNLPRTPKVPIRA